MTNRIRVGDGPLVRLAHAGDDGGPHRSRIVDIGAADAPIRRPNLLGSSALSSMCTPCTGPWRPAPRTARPVHRPVAPSREAGLRRGAPWTFDLRLRPAEPEAADLGDTDWMQPVLS